jgi:hypothetical protein
VRGSAGGGAIHVADDRGRCDAETPHRRGADADVQQDLGERPTGYLHVVGQAGDREQDHRHQPDGDDREALLAPRVEFGELRTVADALGGAVAILALIAVTWSTMRLAGDVEAPE